MKSIPVVLVAAALACPSLPALAKHQITSVARKSASTDITDNFQFGPNCTDGLLIETGYVTQKPAHGTVEILRERTLISQKRFNFPRKVACEGATITVQFVRYTPRPGYVGPDQFSVSWGNNPSVLTYRFLVK